MFKLLLTFIYSESVPDTEDEAKEHEGKDEDADDVMWQQLLVMRQTCETKLCRYVNATTVATILALAEKHRCLSLKEAYLDFLEFPANLQEVLAAGGSDHLRRSCPSVLIDLIAKLASLTIDR